VPNQEPAILTNAVAANRRSAMIDVLPQELERQRFRFPFRDSTRANSIR
jgi:hypothetical protein